MQWSCIPQQRSLVVSLRSALSVLELIVATGMSAARNAATWLFIKASKGEITIVIPWSIIAGNWKHKLFLITSSTGIWEASQGTRYPKEVAIFLFVRYLHVYLGLDEDCSPAWTKTSCPSKAAVMISRWYGLTSVKNGNEHGKEKAEQLPKIGFPEDSSQSEIGVDQGFLARMFRHAERESLDNLRQKNLSIGQGMKNRRHQIQAGILGKWAIVMTSLNHTVLLSRLGK